MDVYVVRAQVCTHVSMYKRTHARMHVCIHASHHCVTVSSHVCIIALLYHCIASSLHTRSTTVPSRNCASVDRGRLRWDDIGVGERVGLLLRRAAIVIAHPYTKILENRQDEACVSNLGNLLQHPFYMTKNLFEAKSVL